MAIFLRRVVLKNYKNIEACDVTLGPLTFLVGPNGSGKSNFLDALQFVSDAMRWDVGQALRARGGLNRVRREMSGEQSFGMRLDMLLDDGTPATYAFEVEGKGRGTEFAVTREHYAIADQGGGRTNSDSSNRLFVSHFNPARRLSAAISSIATYDPQPLQMRRIQAPDPGEVLLRDAANAAGVLARLDAEAPAATARITAYLRAIVPDLLEVEQVSVADQETLRFRQSSSGGRPSRFYASSMSDGTLRALGVLLALFQRRADGTHVLPLVGVEEPEAMLHPGALAVLLDALREASEQAQVIVTSHSPQLLDREDIDDAQIVSVHAEAGRAVIGHLDPTLRAVLRDKLATAGELLGQGQLRAEPAAVELTADQIDLFDFVEEAAG